MITQVFRFPKGALPLRFGRIAADEKMNADLEKSGYKNVAALFRAAKEHYLDSGTDTVLFRIPQNDKYLLALPTKTDTWEKTQASTPEAVFHNKVFESSNAFPEFKLGQAIAKLDDLRLHRKIEGYPNGVPRSKLNYHDDEAYREYEPQAYEVYANKLRDIHAFPQKSYTDLAHFLVRLKASDPPVFFDPTANNLMVDIKKKRFNVIDPSTKADVELHHCTGNNLAGMAAALLDSRWVQIQSKRNDGSTPVAAKDIELQKLRRGVLKKCVLAAHEADLTPQRNPFPEKSEMHKSHDLRYAFKLAGLSKADCNTIISNFHGERFHDTLEKVFAPKS